jgi:hypothetical protein
MQPAPDQLVPLALEPLPLGAIRPEGWLARQLRIQADGLSGHLDEFWPDVAQSGWIGGPAEGWERGPYWLDGVTPLAYLLDDARLIASVQRWMDHILTHQHADGWLGPRQDQATGRYQPLDPWPVSVFLKALIQFHSATGDARAVPAMLRYYRRLDVLLRERPLFDWGRMRWAELALGIHWLYERTGEPWLLALAALVRRQGYDWAALFASFPYRERSQRGALDLTTHVVNHAMAIKTQGVWYRQSGQLGHVGDAYRMLALLDAYHGQATGVFTGDEHLAGLDPSQGTELCAVVEYLYSLEVLLAILGDPALADRLERIAFNALPAAFTPDMWAHQYDQQANQPICQVAPEPIYTNNAPESNLYGLEPNYGCCTANMHQGWPKFAAHLWMRTPATESDPAGLAAVAYAPSRVATEIEGVGVRVRLETDYPFDETLRFTVATEAPVAFPLRLRIPGWAGGTRLRVGDEAENAPEPGAFHVVRRRWEGRTEIALRLPMPLRAETRYRGAAALHLGPLVLALRIGEEWRQVGGELPHADWAVHPTTPWNVALLLDRARPEASVTIERRGVGAAPFSPEGAPLVATVRARRVPAWGLAQGTAGPAPHSPVASDEPLETVTLIPYGATNLRITEFPTLAPAHDAPRPALDAMP